MAPKSHVISYAWTKQAVIYIVCTHAYACMSDLYYSVSTTLRRLLHAVLPSFQRVHLQLYADNTVDNQGYPYI